MNRPAISYEKTIEACQKGFTNKVKLYKNLVAAKYDLKKAADDYLIKGESGALFLLAPFIGQDNEIVICNLTQGNLIRLYECYLRDKEDGRGVYDALLAAAGGKCPFCGGIGRPRNLDHYLPKAQFPAFSFLPINLIPSCRDCNMEDKGVGFAQFEKDQVLHPFLDRDHFFIDQWIFAEYTALKGGPGEVDFYVNPPKDWPVVDIQRAKTHFEIFSINEKYRIKAAPEVSDVECQLKNYLKKNTIEEFKADMLQPVVDNANFPNQWKRVLYKALINQL